VHFTRLRLSGFKSFVDPTELLVEGGLTGVVGPNGCGKSNLLEGLRWAMGEYRVKSLRGSGMDDVIFSGTDIRPARNLAEVTLFLDNSQRRAPAPFNDSGELEVSRRIERESGSAYRINGKEVRAKDVQLLFADAATGAHSPALVSQGRVGELISAKPQNRRAILEEAAGITGLHTRRKEAESRLRSAANNLLRLQDVIVQMEAQRSALKRQARQATRYKNISGDIRRAEACFYYVRWQAIAQSILEIGAQLTDVQKEVGELTATVSKLTTQEAGLVAQLPDLRLGEAEMAAALHRLVVESENLALEEARKQQRLEELESHSLQTRDDQAREAENVSDAAAAIANIGLETKGLVSQADPEHEDQAKNSLQSAHEAASRAETHYDGLAANYAREQVQQENIVEDQASLRRRIERFSKEGERLASELAANGGEAEEGNILLQSRQAIEAAEVQRAQADEGLTDADKARQLALEERDRSRHALAEAKAKVGGIEAEIRGLQQSLKQGAIATGVAISESLTVDKGFEIALGVVLGDDLEAPEAEDQAFGWHRVQPLSPAQELPEGTVTLESHVKGASVLSRRLSQTGLVAAEDGPRLSSLLKPGQRLVTEAGALWRWDGFHKTAEVPSPAAVRLAQRNRLGELGEQRNGARSEANDLGVALKRQEDSVDEALERERVARKERTQSEQSLEAARRDLADVENKTSERTARLAAMEEAKSRVAADLLESRERLENLEQQSQRLPDLSERQAELETARQEMEKLRAALASARAEYDGLRRRQSDREARQNALQRDNEAWSGRLERARGRQQELADRADEIEKAIAMAMESPEEAELRRKALLDQIEKAETRRNKAADKLVTAESKTTEAGQKLKAEEGRLAEARELRARVETAFEAEETRREEMAAAINEKFNCLPTELRSETGLKPDAEPPELEAVDRRLERLRAERERLGAVNLRADIELEEIAEQIDHLTSERQDLEAAIARLRQGIGSINREGRERMLAAFGEVNQHFGELFTTLFDGGEAHLALIDSDDPLEAGLEIMASPPGKKLQSLSLLSGGEQALTAISLIFAVFMTNPAPICVLDEVDAPLDDANVERFCNLLDDISRRTETRFLIVTHNAVTMARMDRLFGVTMAERGVSQLVSVDLETAEELRVAS
jgi:chromosome segregation protein